MIDQAIPTLVLIGLAAVLAPIIADASRRYLPVPEVVIQIILGIAMGPYVLNIAHPNSIVTAFSDFGLTYLMFLAGTELDLATMRSGHLERAAGSWGVSLFLALGVGAALHGTGLVLDSVVVALCLTTTAPRDAPPDSARRRCPAHRHRSEHALGRVDRRIRPDRRCRGAAHQPRRAPDRPAARVVRRGCCRCRAAGLAGPPAPVRRPAAPPPALHARSSRSGYRWCW